MFTIITAGNTINSQFLKMSSSRKHLIQVMCNSSLDGAREHPLPHQSHVQGGELGGRLDVVLVDVGDVLGQSEDKQQTSCDLFTTSQCCVTQLGLL